MKISMFNCQNKFVCTVQYADFHSKEVQSMINVYEADLNNLRPVLGNAFHLSPLPSCRFWV